MIVAMEAEASDAQIQRAIGALLDLGFEVHRETGAERTVLACLGRATGAAAADLAGIAALSGVAAVHRITAPYKLAARAARPAPTVVEAAGLRIGGGELAIIAADAIAPRGAGLGLWGPPPGASTSGARGQAAPGPAPIHVAGARALRARPPFAPLRQTCDRLGWAAVGAVASESDVPEAAAQLDLLEAAAADLRRNPHLVRALAAAAKPVLVAAAPAEPLDDLLLGAETLLLAGLASVALLLPAALALADIPRLKRLTHLPVVCDLAAAPRDLADTMARAAAAAGADAVVLAG